MFILFKGLLCLIFWGVERFCFWEKNIGICILFFKKGEYFLIVKILKFFIICFFIKLKVGRDIKIVWNFKYLMSFYKFWFNFWIFICLINVFDIV